jgi:hypothetical protein
VPPARGRASGASERRTFAVLVAYVDRERTGEAAIVGKRVSGPVRAPEGSLLLVYGEDRAPLDGSCRQHMVDLYRDERAGLRRIDFGILTGDWLAVALASIEDAMLERLPTREQLSQARERFGDGHDAA